MNTTENAIELLVIEPSLDAAENYIKSLRNAGLAIHPTQITEETELTAALNGSALDLILCSAETGRERFQASLDQCLKARSDIPVIVVYDDQIPAIYFKVSGQFLNRPPAAVHESHRLGQQNRLVFDVAAPVTHVELVFIDGDAKFSGELIDHHKPDIVACVFVLGSGVAQADDQTHT